MNNNAVIRSKFIRSVVFSRNFTPIFIGVVFCYFLVLGLFAVPGLKSINDIEDPKKTLDHLNYLLLKHKIHS